MSKNKLSEKIERSTISDFSKDFHKNPHYLLSQNAATLVDLNEVLLSRKQYNQINHNFSDCLSQEASASSQEKTGRCWLFAALNVMRLEMMKKYQLKNFEFSQNYLFFWDKLERANYFLENIIKTRAEKGDSRIVNWLLSCPIGDGGQWSMFVNLVNKYGLVPKTAMPENFPSNNSLRMNQILFGKLREFAMRLRNSKKKSLSELRSEKQRFLKVIYRILCIFLGEAPQKFDWCFRDKNDKHHEYLDLNPHSFLQKHVPYEVNDKVCLIHAPMQNKDFYKSYTVEYLGNVIEGQAIKYINLPINVLSQVAATSIKWDEAVWFGADVGKDFSLKLGSMDAELYDTELALGTKVRLNKGQRLEYLQSLPNHAMVLTGFDRKNKKIEKWKVENSWGEKHGEKGYFCMTHSWFKEHLFEVVVDKKFLAKKVLQLLEEKSEILPPWDPMGTLAK